MSGLGRDAMDLLAEARDGDGPSPEDRARVRRRLLQLGVGAAVTTAASATAAASSAAAGAAVAGSVTAKGAIAGGVAAGAGAGSPVSAASSISMLVIKLAVAAAVGGSVGAVGLKGVEVVVQARHAAVVASTSRPQPVPGAAEPARGASARAGYAPSVPEPPISEPAVAERAPQPPPGATPATTSGATAHGSAKPDTVEAESRLLRAAEGARRDGNPERALALLDQHAALFPSGVLTEERAADRIYALCDLGRVAEAVAEAERFLAERPRSPEAAHVRDSCNRAGAR